ncbi:helix-turn-helix domain-containing protein [Brachybacterium hainanense]|uniref:Helix-turn-helix domain-containing protein n=1 Tax=Brachybacterium hainanense TaxID=1541174 RepID=A0ABV6R971_9MICO
MTDHARRIIDQAEDAWFILQGMARAQTQAAGPKVQTSTTPAAPLNLTMHDLAVDIATILRDLALDIADTTGEWPDGLDATGAAAFARARTEHIIGHEGREETIATLADRHRTATGILGMLPRRTRVPEPCECGAQQHVYHEHVAYVRCEDGHLASLADHAYAAGAGHFTIGQAARILGVSDRTIGRLLERGDLWGSRGSSGRRGFVDAASVTAFRHGLARRAHAG